MNLLIDNAIAPSVAERLRKVGHDAVHVRDYQMQAASDEEILQLAEREDRVIVSADTDFGTLLALRSRSKPSFILLRRQRDTTPAKTAAVLVDVLPSIEKDLISGSVVVITDNRLRIRNLPVRTNDK